MCCQVGKCCESTYSFKFLMTDTPRVATVQEMFRVRGQGIAGILTFLCAKPGYMPSTALTIICSESCQKPSSNHGKYNVKFKL